MRRAARRDGNEAAIVKALEAAGWHVARCSTEGFPDLYCTKGSRWMWLEVKQPGGGLQRAQRDLWTQWMVGGIDVHVAETAQHVQALDRVGTSPCRWEDYPVDKRGRGAKRSKPKSWIPARLRAKAK